MSTLSAVPDLGLTHLHRGKVRDLFDAGDDRLVMVASDRLSAFDVVMAEPVPDKGRVLTAMSVAWFDELSDLIGNHLISADVADLPESAQLPELAGRVMLCRRARMLPIECIVRGFVTGSAWKEYRREGTIHDMAVAPGLIEADRLTEPLFTPSTKAAVGDHDENISFDRAVELVGGDLAERALGSEPGHVPLRCRAGRGGGLPPGRHQVRAGPGGRRRGRRDARARRRGPHARLVTVLGGRRLGPRLHSAGVRQAAGTGLPGVARVGQTSARTAAAGRRCRGDRVALTARPTSASVAGRSIAGPAPDRPSGAPDRPSEALERVTRASARCDRLGT
ncbi:MAG: phosphoribosylaminoimidazolesuccinocarboxamide synthase [Microthrixaceae bacterium]